jgi:hypothetical protein
MPSSSKKQHNFMAAIANSPSFAKKVGVPQSVGKDFTTADKGRKFSKGGDTMASKMNPGFMAMMAKKKGMQEGSKADMASDKKQMMGMKKGGMAKGDMPAALAKHAAKPASKAHAGLKAGGVIASKMGTVKTAAPSRDGVASKGKTKGTMVKMKSGGRTC